MNKANMRTSVFVILVQAVSIIALVCDPDSFGNTYICPQLGTANDGAVEPAKYNPAPTGVKVFGKKGNGVEWDVGEFVATFTKPTCFVQIKVAISKMYSKCWIDKTCKHNDENKAWAKMTVYDFRGKVIGEVYSEVFQDRPYTLEFSAPENQIGWIAVGAAPNSAWNVIVDELVWGGGVCTPLKDFLSVSVARASCGVIKKKQSPSSYADFVQTLETDYEDRKTPFRLIVAATRFGKQVDFFVDKITAVVQKQLTNGRKVHTYVPIAKVANWNSATLAYGIKLINLNYTKYNKKIVGVLVECSGDTFGGAGYIDLTLPCINPEPTVLATASTGTRKKFTPFPAAGVASDNTDYTFTDLLGSNALFQEDNYDVLGGGLSDYSFDDLVGTAGNIINKLNGRS